MTGQKQESRDGQSLNPDETLSGFFRDIRGFFGQFLQLLAKVVIFVPIFLYFSIYWRKKERFRQISKKTALVYFTASFILFLLELLVKVTGKPVFGYIQNRLSAWELPMFGLLVIFGLVLIRHNFHEAKQAAGEYRLGERLWQLLSSPAERHLISQPSMFLELAVDVFKQFGATRACIWVLDGDVLRVPDHCWHPSANSVDLLRELPMVESVAGQVLKDGAARYVPRLFFPFNRPALRQFSFPFRHAMLFSARLDSNGNGRLDVAGRYLATRSVYFPEDKVPNSLVSFLAVPIADGAAEVPHGVLCIEFSGTDPLDTTGIKLGAMIAVLAAIVHARAETIVGRVDGNAQSK